MARAKRGKTRASKSRLVLVLLLIGRGAGARFFNQSQSVAMQNQSNCGITFDTQLKIALFKRNEVISFVFLCNRVRTVITTAILDPPSLFLDFSKTSENRPN